MIDNSSGRDPQTNSGSDSAKHHTGTAHDQYQRQPGIPKSEVVTNRHPNGAVGNGTPGKADDRSIVKS
jgi:hypothetical protein